MSFPLNPTNGQQATVNNLLYTYNSTVGAWTIATQNQSAGLVVASLSSSGPITGTLATAAQPNVTSVGTLSSLSVTGTITGGNLSTAGSLSAATITETSSRDLKTNFRNVENSLETVLKLTAFIYDRKDGSEVDELGLIAEDVDPVIKNLVMYDDAGKPIGIKYTRVGVLCLEAIKELHKEITQIKSQINK